MNQIDITALDGFKFGHAEDLQAATGCTVVIAEKGAVAGVDVRGGSPGTRETDLLKSENLVENVHCVFLAGGSAFGLDAAGGIMTFLEDRGIGFDVQVTRVPIVTGAILFDLMIGDSTIRPDKKMGRLACENAFSQTIPLPNGTVGAGTGATIGKALGVDYAMKAGLGSYAIQEGDFKIGAVVAVNCFGDVINPSTGEVLAGLFDKEKRSFLNTEKVLLQQLDAQTNRFSGNTTIGAICTNAKITKAQANKIASMAHDGYARTMRPAHTMVDGDTIFALSTDEVHVDLNIVGFLAAYVMEKAIMEAVSNARSLGGFMALQDIKS